MTSNVNHTPIVRAYIYEITQIAIPGSHDCGTYALNKKLPVGPDEADILQSLGKIPFKSWVSKIFR